jgi:uncharacterized membrane protein
MEERLLPRPRISKGLIITFLVLAVIGFADSAYLTAEHIRGSIPPCSVVQGCNTVLTSAYATVAGVPIAAAGMAYYAVLVILVVAYLDTGVLAWLHRASWLTVGGLLASAYFIVIQAFVLHAFCLYCLVSAATSTTLFVLGFIVMRRD